MLIKARILKKQGDLQEAINCLKAAMALPGVRTGGGKCWRLQCFDAVGLGDRLIKLLL